MIPPRRLVPGWVAVSALVFLTGSAAAIPAVRRPLLRFLSEAPQEVDPGKEYGVKAGFLANFIRYTLWPDASFPSADAPLVVAIVGTNRYGAAIEKVVRARPYKGRPIHVVRSTELRGTAHVVFSTGMHAEARSELARACAGQSILLVGEYTGFAAQGAGLNFYLDGGKVRFEANPDALRAAGLKVSSELLKLARKVTGGSE